MNVRVELSHSHPLRPCASGCPVFCGSGTLSLSAPSGVCGALSFRLLECLEACEAGFCNSAMGMYFLCRSSHRMDCDSARGPIRPVAAGCNSASCSSGLDCLLPVGFCRHGLGGKARSPFDLAGRILCASGSRYFSISLSKCESLPRLDYGSLSRTDGGPCLSGEGFLLQCQPSRLAFELRRRFRALHRRLGASEPLATPPPALRCGHVFRRGHPDPESRRTTRSRCCTGCLSYSQHPRPPARSLGQPGKDVWLGGLGSFGHSGSGLAGL